MEKNPKYPTPEEESIRFISRFYSEAKADTSAAWKKITRAIHKQPSSKRRIPIYRIGIAAAILTGIIAGIGYHRMKTQADWIIIAAQAEKQEIVLPDHSAITLSPGSSIRYDRLSFGKKERYIELAGKAFFNVNHLKNVPFHINTPLADIQVLGTQFQVVSTKDSTVTWIVSGKVRFSTSRQCTDLTQNMRAIVNRENGQIQVSAKDHLNELAWKTHRLVYQNTPLREVVADLEKLYQIKLKNIPPQNLKLTATFDTMEISDILYIINQTLDTNLTITIQQ